MGQAPHDSILDRLPPQNLEAEQAVLGSILIDPTTLDGVREIVGPRDFYRETHGIIFRAMLAVSKAESAIDLVTLSSQLEADTQLDTVGGPSYLTTLIGTVPTSIHAQHYAGLVSKLATRRRLIAASGEIAGLAFDSAFNVDDCIARSREVIDAVAPRGDANADVIPWANSIDEAIRFIEQDVSEARAGVKRLDWPWMGLNRVAPRLLPGTLVGVLAESSVGKTAFVEQVAEYWAVKGFTTIFFHLELSHKVMMYRRMSRLTGIPMSDFYLGRNDQEKVDEATDMTVTWPGRIHYVSASGYTSDRIIHTVHKIQRDEPVHAVVVDYLQKIHGGADFNIAQRLSEALEDLKVLAERSSVVVLIPAQYNASGKAERIKTAEKVRDTAALEDKANIIVTLDRPRATTAGNMKADGTRLNEGERIARTTVRVDKNTTGQTSVCYMAYKGARLSFYDETTR